MTQPNYLQQDLNAIGNPQPQTYQVVNNFPSSYQNTLSSMAKGPGFTIVGIIIFGIVLWVSSQNATGQVRSIINGFLGVLLLSMVLLHWSKIKPIFFK